MDMFPKRASLFKSVQAKIFAKNVYFGNTYWCQTSDGAITDAILVKEVVPHINQERIFINCNLEPQYFPRKLSLRILTNGGLLMTSVGNFIDYKIDPLP
jgi:hypothetical protein